MKLHTGFRSAQRAIVQRGPDTAPPAIAQTPAIAAPPKMPRPATKPAAKAKGLPFGGKAAPLFTKKTAR